MATKPWARVVAVSVRKFVSIELSDTTHNQVALLALAWGVSQSEAVQRLVDHFQHTSSPKKSEEGLIHVHALYEGVRVEGLRPDGRERDRDGRAGAGAVQVSERSGRRGAARAESQGECQSERMVLLGHHGYRQPVADDPSALSCCPYLNRARETFRVGSYGLGDLGGEVRRPRSFCREFWIPGSSIL